MMNAVGGIWTKASDGRSFLYVCFRAACSDWNHVTIEGSTQFGMESKSGAAWNGAQP